MRACPSWATGCVTCCASIALPQERDGEEADDEGEGEDVPEHEARRRRGLTASARRVQKLRALEKANPYGVLPVVYLTDLYHSKRFEHVDAGLRYDIVVHVLHHHQSSFTSSTTTSATSSRERTTPSSDRRRISGGAAAAATAVDMRAVDMA